MKNPTQYDQSADALRFNPEEDEKAQKEFEAQCTGCPDCVAPAQEKVKESA